MEVKSKIVYWNSIIQTNSIINKKIISDSMIGSRVLMDGIFERLSIGDYNHLVRKFFMETNPCHLFTYSFLAGSSKGSGWKDLKEVFRMQKTNKKKSKTRSTQHLSSKVAENERLFIEAQENENARSIWRCNSFIFASALDSKNYSYPYFELQYVYYASNKDHKASESSHGGC